MNPFNKILIITIFLIFQLCLYGQEDITDDSSSEYQISILAKGYGDSIVIRVLPIDPLVSPYVLNNGFDIYRLAVKNGVADRGDEFKKINSDRIKPIREEELQTLINTSQDTVLTAIMQILYPNKENFSTFEGLENTGTLMSYLETITLGCNVLSSMNNFYADILGLRFVDKDINNEGEYIYKLDFYDDNGSIIGNYYSISSTNLIEPSPIKIYRSSETYQSVGIYWNAVERMKDFFLYHVEKSKDNINYNRITDTPILHMTSQEEELATDYVFFTDSLENYDPHYYRIIGVTYFGEESKPSEPVRLQAIDDVPPSAPFLFQCITVDETVMNVRWSKDTLDFEPDFVGYNIYKGPTDDGPFYRLNEELIGKNETNFIDIYFKVDIETYYKVCAVDTAGNEGCSFSLSAFYRDTIPPAIPTGLIATIDSSGIVTLTWDENTESDLLGYFVFASNEPESDFVKITGDPITVNKFIDTLRLNTLTQYIYYKVASIDYTTNISDLSEWVRAARPDTIPPTNTIIISIEPQEQGNYIRWIASTMIDINRQEIERMSIENPEWRKISELKPYEEEFVDFDYESGKKYAYRIKTYDHSGNFSYSVNEYAVNSWRRTRYDAPHITIKTEEGSAVLSWKFDGPNPREIFIYRSKVEEPIRSFKKIEYENTDQWIDTSVIKNEVYKYMIRIKAEDGVLSGFSNEAINELK
jgi:uncharacterized protein